MATGRDTWESLAGSFLDGAYESVKGFVRTFVLHNHLLDHLPPPPATVLDVGGGAGNQSFPLASAGYRVTLLDSSPAMLERAARERDRLPPAVCERIELLGGDGESASEVVGGRRFDAVLCHGVLGYLESPARMIEQLSLSSTPNGVVSIMTANAGAMAVRPALEQRWSDALSAFDSRTEIGVLGVSSRADTVDELSNLLGRHGVEPVAWYGVWLFVDWLGFAGVDLDPADRERLNRIAATELEASRRDPYRQMSRVFHLIGRKTS